MDLRKKVLILLARIGCGQRELARESGVSQSTVCKYCSGERGERPSLSILKKLQKVANNNKIDIDFLSTEE